MRDGLAAPAPSLAGLGLAARISGVAVALVGVAVLVGWALDLRWLTGLRPHLATMKPNTALAFLLAGTALTLLADTARGFRSAVARACAALVVLVAALTLVEYGVGASLGIDELLFADEPGAQGTPFPGRMGVNTALGFLLLGLALAGLDLHALGTWPAQVLALAGGGIAAIALVGYLYSATALYGMASYTQMALHTAGTLVLLAAGILLARPDRGIVAVLGSSGPGGALARRFLLAALVVPVALGWLRLEGQRAGWFGTEIGLALMVAATAAAYTALAWWSSVGLDQADAGRRESEARKEVVQDALAKSTARLSLLHEIDRALISAQTTTAIAEAVLPRLRDLLGVPRAIVNLFDLQAGEVVWLAAVGRRQMYRGPQIRYPLRLAGDIDGLRRGEPQILDARALPPSPEAEALLVSGVYYYMVVPMIVGGDLIGSVSFGGDQAEFPKEQVAIAAEVAAQLGIAIAQARLHERVQLQAERLRILREIDQAIIAAVAPAAIASAALARLRPLLGTPRASVTVLDLETGEGEWVAVETVGPSRLVAGTRFPIALVGDLTALRKGEIVVFEDVAAVKGLPLAETMIAEGILAYLVVPLVVGDELIGSLNFGAQRPGPFSPDQVTLAREVAVPLAVAISQARLHERIARQSEELERRVGERTRELRTANVQLEQEIDERRRAQAAADGANRAKSEFLANMSHELRTPLNAIIGFGEILHDGRAGPVSPEQREFLGDILVSGRHLLQLINDILDLAKVESGALELRPEPVDVMRLIAELRQVLRPVAGRKRIHLAVDVDPTLGSLFLDAAKLRQILYNYLSNAIKFTPEEGRVVLRAIGEGPDAVRFEVEDTGIGIRAEDLGRLFVEFQQIDSSLAKEHPGTGLGLALTRRLVEAQGGRVGVRSAPGVGSTFFAVLPRRTAT